jgi:hypothetical protein
MKTRSSGESDDSKSGLAISDEKRVWRKGAYREEKVLDTLNLRWQCSSVLGEISTSAVILNKWDATIRLGICISALVKALGGNHAHMRDLSDLAAPNNSDMEYTGHEFYDRHMAMLSWTM